MRIHRRSIEISGLSDITQRRIPVLVADSGVAGPVLCLTACVHGDEVGGIAIVHEVMRDLRAHGLGRGALHAFPLINSPGFENASRFIAADREDLNRCFPGNPSGGLGQRIAFRLFDAIRRAAPALVVDLHNDWNRSIPYLIVEPVSEYATPELAQRTRDLARATGLPLVEDSDVFDPAANTLSGALVSAGIAAFTVETAGSFAVAEDAVAAGRDAMLRLLVKLGMRAADSTLGELPSGGSTLRYSDRPHTATSGLVRFAVAPGEQVRAGQAVASVYSAYGARDETLRAERGGIVLGLCDHGRVLPGRVVIAIGETATGRDDADSRE